MRPAGFLMLIGMVYAFLTFQGFASSSAEVTTVSNWLKGYSVEVDGVQVGTDGIGSDVLDGTYTFYVEGSMYHSIKVNHSQFWKSWKYFFMADRKHTADIDDPGSAIYIESALSPGWDDFSGDALPFSGKVKYTLTDEGEPLKVNFEISGAAPKHSYIVGAHFFDPGSYLPGSLAAVCNFSNKNSCSTCPWMVTCKSGPLIREGNNATALGAWDFGYLLTDESGSGAFQGDLGFPQPGIYFVQFTVRVGDKCDLAAGETYGCPVVYRTGTKLGVGFEEIRIPVPQKQSQGASQPIMFSKVPGSDVEMVLPKQSQGSSSASTQPPLAQSSGGNALYIDAGIQDTARFMSVSQHSKMTIIAETPAGGQGEIFELYPATGGQSTYAISTFNFYPGKNNLQYNAEVPGRHYLFSSLNNQTSNVIVIDVQGGLGTSGGLGQPLSLQSNPSEDSKGSNSDTKSTISGTIPSGSAEVTAASSWLKGYSVEVDGVQIGTDGTGSDVLDGIYKFYVTGNQQHNIKVNHPQFWKSWADFFMAGGKYTANIDVPGRVVKSS